MLVGDDKGDRPPSCADLPRQLVREPEVRAAHVVEIRWDGVGSFDCLRRTRPDIDYHLETGIEGVEEVAEPVDPGQSIRLGRVCKSQLTRLDHGDIGAARPEHLGFAVSQPEWTDRKRARHEASTSAVSRVGARLTQLSRRVLTTNSTQSVSQPSAGRPRQRPQASVAPTSSTIAANSPRTGATSQPEDQTASAPSTARTM